MYKPATSVLVIEDNPQNMMFMRDLLEASGYNVLQAKDGMQGWDLAREHRPDLIVMDIQLPDVSGLEITRWLKDDAFLKSIPIIAVTAFAMDSDEERILEGGFDAYISKPISISNFLQTLERYVGCSLKEPRKGEYLHDTKN
jgi:two-component system cell cycle response regulator DivK